jgi:hypothetical protein
MPAWVDAPALRMGQPRAKAAALNLDGFFNLPTIPARHHKRHQNTSLVAPVKHAPVTRLQPVRGQGQAPQATPNIRIDTGQVGSHTVKQCRAQGRGADLSAPQTFDVIKGMNQGKLAVAGNGRADHSRSDVL